MMSKCHACGKPTHIDLLDAKPGNGEKFDPNCPDWERFECWECYGKGFIPVEKALRANSPQMIETMEARRAR